MIKILKLTLAILLLFGSITLPVYAFDVPTEEYANDGNTMLLVHWNEADGNTTPDDASTSDHTLTNAGNVQCDDGITKFGNTSTYDGTGDWWTIPDHADFYMSGDLTAECWVYVTDQTTSNSIWGQAISTNERVLMSILSDPWNILYFNHHNSAGTLTIGVQTGEGAISNNTLTHVAVVRDGNEWDMYVGGTSEGNSTDSDSVTDFTSIFSIGANYNTSTYDDPFKGNIEEFRISDVARTWAPEAVGQCMSLVKIDKWNPELAKKIRRTTGRWNIQDQTWWRNFHWNNIRGTEYEEMFDFVIANFSMYSRSGC